MMKKKKNVITSAVKSDFYKLDPSKPITAEGYKSLFPWVFFAVSVFFCAILAFIIIVNEKNGTFDFNEYKIFFILCGIFLGIATVLLAGYLTRNAVIRKRILASDVTYATITSARVSERRTRDKDGDIKVKHDVAIKYEFYDRDGNVRSEEFNKIYGRAPEFYEGQQIVVAFDEEKCFILSKYKLINDSVDQEKTFDANGIAKQSFSGETLTIDLNKYVPLGYDKRYYIITAIYSFFALIFVALLTYFAVTVQDSFVWIYALMCGLFIVIFLILALKTAFVPFKTKRDFDSIVSIGTTYTRGKLESTNKVYGNGAVGRYVCVYADADGREKRFKLSPIMLTKILVRNGDTDVVVAYAQNKAIALIKKSQFR